MRRFFAAAALVALTTSMLSACGSDPQDGAVGPAATTDPTASAQALAFEAPLVGGGNLDFRTLSDTTVALWFWAPT